MKYLVEVCAGSVEDCLIAEQQGAHRIELNNAVHLGGLTPSVGTLIEAKKRVDIPIIAMLRARPGGFYYNDVEIETMFRDAEELIKHGVDGIVFGFLNEDASVDVQTTKKFVELAKKHEVEAIFHRAYDRANDPYEAIEALIVCGVDRILTSGQKPTADQGIDLLKDLHKRYGPKIELCVGAGVNISNVDTILVKTSINQVHSSFKGWFKDPTTHGKVSYQYDEKGDYEGVSRQVLKAFIDHLENVEK
ncbi:copper homeostasis protein CutC [Erysipelothrix urinaevulpis]|uniref:copper homeostasis protein CutC n=1 Tax=Erysipelothrix urinaevulpis TaxID=2683717 RepID=UPI00135ABB61|nr:copper homeostasis protein CutC [Erysipelothrix urinaevulpis]